MVNLYQFMAMEKILENGFTNDHCDALYKVFKKGKISEFIILVQIKILII